MDHYRPSETNMRLGARANRRRNGTIGAAGRLRLLYCLAALFLGVSPARADYLLDLSVPPQDSLGLAFPGPSAAYYAAVSSGGMGVVRLSVAWKYREPAPGQYEWDGLDRRIVQLQTLGIEPFLTFESNAEWATRPETHGITNSTPINMSDWTNLVSLAVDRYDGDGWNDAPGLLRPVRYYQTANEWTGAHNPHGGWRGTEQELIEFINATHDAVKSVDPAAVFVLGGIASETLDVIALNRGIADYDISNRHGPEDPFVTTPASHYRKPVYDNAIAHGAALISQMKFDMVDLHLYGPADRDPFRIQAVRGVIGNVPLLSAECGGPSMHYQDYFPEDHFMAAVQRNLTVLSEGLEYCLWFRLGSGPGATFGNSKTALFDESLADKPGYSAYKLLAYILQDMISVERGAGNSFTIHRDGRPPLVVAWLEDGQQAGYLDLPETVTGSVMEVTDPVLGTYQVTPTEGIGSVPLSPWPKIVGELP